MRRLFLLLLPFALAACTATGVGGPVLPGYVNAPPPPLAASEGHAAAWASCGRGRERR